MCPAEPACWYWYEIRLTWIGEARSMSHPDSGKSRYRSLFQGALSVLRSLRERKQDNQCRTLCYGRVQIDPAAVLIDNAPHDCQSQSGAPSAGCEERFKNLVGILWRNARAVIFDSDFDSRLRFMEESARPDRYVPPFRNGMNGVAKDVLKQLKKLVPISHDRGQFFFALHPQVNGFLRRFCQQRH